MIANGSLPSSKCGFTKNFVEGLEVCEFYGNIYMVEKVRADNPPFSRTKSFNKCCQKMAKHFFNEWVWTGSKRALVILLHLATSRLPFKLVVLVAQDSSEIHPPKPPESRGKNQKLYGQWTIDFQPANDCLSDEAAMKFNNPCNPKDGRLLFYAGVKNV